MKAPVYDVEVYPNYHSVGVLECDGSILHFSSLRGNLDDLVDWWEAQTAKLVGYNNHSYDDHIVYALLKGERDPAVIFALSCNRISVKEKFTSTPLHNTIDILAMLGGAKLGLSLKEIAVKLDHPKLQELPYEFNSELTDAQMREVEEYNVNDLRITARLMEVVSDALDAREALGLIHGVDVMSRMDSSLASPILQQKMFGPNRPPRVERTAWSVKGAEILHPGISFESPKLQDVLQTVREWTLATQFVYAEDGTKTLPAAEPTELHVVHNDVKYKIGIGGLHSDDGPATFHSDEEFDLLEVDVASYYPALIRSMGLCPEHLDPETFQRAFGGLVDERLKAKATGQTALNLGLKIAINSVFGKLGSAYGYLTDPRTMWSVTLNGQLILLMLIELIGEHGEVLSANTDGILVRVRKDQRLQVENCVTAIESYFGLHFEYTDFKALIRRDINNYVAVETSGKLKTRGDYGYTRGNLKSKSTNRIVTDAVRRYFVDGIPVEDTIRACQDIREFLNYFKASAGYHLEDGNGVHLGKIARWYHSTSGSPLTKIKGHSKATITSNRPVIVLVDLEEGGELPSDIDYQFYIGAAKKLISDIEDPEIKKSSSVDIADMSKEQFALFKRNNDIREADPDHLAKVDVVALRAAYDNCGGQYYTTMKRLLARAHHAGKGLLTRGDLVAVGRLIDEGTDYFVTRDKARALTSLAGFYTRTVSPFPRNPTIEEVAEEALTWAKTLPVSDKPIDISEKSLLLASTLTAYCKSGDMPKFARSIAARALKNCFPVDVTALATILRDHERKPIVKTEPVKPALEIPNINSDAEREIRVTTEVKATEETRVTSPHTKSNDWRGLVMGKSYCRPKALAKLEKNWI